MKRAALFAILLTVLGAAAWAAPKIVVSHAIAVRGDPKYPAGFRNFDYVNPNAPKGGTLRLAAIGTTYDSFNRYAQRGNPAAASDSIYDSLMTLSSDEIEVYYGLIAEKIEYPEDYSWVVFHLNPKARFQDGKPITAGDVVFSFNKFLEQGVPQFKQYHGDVDKVEALDRLRVRFTFKPGQGTREKVAALASLTVLPEHYWKSRDLSEPTTEVPLGSGAYTVSDYKMGQYVVYKRLPDYWAMDLPAVKGQLNFDYIRYDYYRDETVALEALKAGEYDFRQENVASIWATMYTGPNFDAGYLIKENIPHEIPPGMQAWVFNLQRPLFQDRQVRLALTYAFDFEWANKNLFYGQYTRTRSYFENTPYAAKGLPSREELKYLEPLRDRIPPEVFTREYEPPKTDGSGNIRSEIRTALGLLKQAGWEIRDQKLVNVRSGEPFEFELLIYTPTWERVAVPFQKNLERLGVKMNIRLVDTSQYINRVHGRDFDMVVEGYGPFLYPSTDMKILFRSNYIDSTWNVAGIQDPAVDALIDLIDANQRDEEALLALGAALDRVLTWNYYVIPQWHLSSFRVAYWNKFSRPAIRPKYALGLTTWWVDAAKEASLPKR